MLRNDSSIDQYQKLKTDTRPVHYTWISSVNIINAYAQCIKFATFLNTCTYTHTTYMYVHNTVISCGVD